MDGEADDEIEGLVLAQHYGAEYLCADGNWYAGRTFSAQEADAVSECRARWKTGALGVRVVEHRKTVTQQRIRKADQ